MDHNNILGTVLAGGKSQRFGEDKSQVKLAGKLLIDHMLTEIINEFKMPFKFPNVEHLVPISPGASAERWASDILRPIGKSGIAQFVITNGSVIREDLKIQKGVKGIFSLEHSKRFEANVNVRLEIFKDQKKSVARASASRSQTLREDASPNLQSRLWYNLVERLMESFNREMRNQINTHLRLFVS